MMQESAKRKKEPSNPKSYPLAAAPVFAAQQEETKDDQPKGANNQNMMNTTK